MRVRFKVIWNGGANKPRCHDPFLWVKVSKIRVPKASILVLHSSLSFPFSMTLQDSKQICSRDSERIVAKFDSHLTVC